MAAVLALLPAAAGAVTWNIDFGSFATTFEAPAGGGAVSGLVALLGGVTFDTPDPADPPFYNVSTNDFSAEDGSICYFGEAVDIHHPDGSVTHEGAWRADDGPGFAPGIMMPADPRVGDRFQMEVAPGIAEDEGRIVGTGGVTVPAGPFPETIRVREFNPLDADKGYKVFAHGVGLVIDAAVELTEY